MTKTRPYILLLLLALSAPAVVIAAPAEPVSAEADYTAFDALSKERPPGSVVESGVENYLKWLDTHRQQVTAAGLAYYAAYPTDPRRWEAVLTLVNQRPFFALSYGPDVDKLGLRAAIVDEAAKAAWMEKTEQLQEALVASADAPPVVRQRAEWNMFGLDFQAIAKAQANGEPFDFSPLRARFDAHIAKYKDLDDALLESADDYLGALENQVPGASAEIWRHLLDAPNGALRNKAAQQMKFAAMMSEPLDIAFTAADGRAVDLKNLRGKVVLIDFWATWCGPCIAELPNAKQVYSAYHDKGFEIIGISLENGKLAPNETPEQTETKLAAARTILADFTIKEGMPWPQYFDGKWWKNEIATRFNVRGIPAMFLLDQEGKIVSTNARGEKLEAEVKRLLGL